jgi:hypothetical protein
LTKSVDHDTSREKWKNISTDDITSRHGNIVVAHNVNKSVTWTQLLITPILIPTLYTALVGILFWYGYGVENYGDALIIQAQYRLDLSEYYQRKASFY